MRPIYMKKKFSVYLKLKLMLASCIYLVALSSPHCVLFCTEGTTCFPHRVSVGMDNIVWTGDRR